MVRAAIEQLYIGRCDIYEYRAATNPANKREELSEILIYASQPCRLSIQNSSVAGEGETSAIGQVIKLFLAPEVDVLPGSKIIVTQHGKTTQYRNSGIAARYSGHQEIMLERMEKRA